MAKTTGARWRNNRDKISEAHYRYTGVWLGVHEEVDNEVEVKHPKLDEFLFTYCFENPARVPSGDADALDTFLDEAELAREASRPDDLNDTR